jgi:hypothetical protein
MCDRSKIIAKDNPARTNRSFLTTPTQKCTTFRSLRTTIFNSGSNHSGSFSMNVKNAVEKLAAFA